MNQTKKPLLILMVIVLLGSSGWMPSVSGQTREQLQKNSGKKIRVKPSEQARKIGTGIQWETDWTVAAEKSAKAGKPIFWYVPTLPDSFMDRKFEIDRYMMAGPFSWPASINALNEYFVPLRFEPKPEQQEKFGLKPFKFIEPGFLILDTEQKVVDKVDRITTMHTQWLPSHLAKHVKVSNIETPQQVQDLWAALRKGVYSEIESQKPVEGFATEQYLLEGMIEFRRGNHQAARQRWELAAKAQPDHPLAFKAAAEKENFGPFVRGFEVHRTIPALAMKAGSESKGSAAPKESYTETELWKRSVDFLLGMQRADGGWVDSDYDYGGTDSLPNVHVAVTSLCGMALLQSKSKVPQREKEIQDAIRRAVSFVTDKKNINTDDTDEILWAYAFRLRFLARLAKVDDTVIGLVHSAGGDLQGIQSKQGAWYHEYRNPFVTATALCALSDAKSVGFKTDSDVINKGLASLTNDRFSNGAFPYSTRSSAAGPDRKKGPGTERSLAASAGRMPLCELALQLWDRSEQPALLKAIERSVEDHATLASALKYDDHTSNLGYGGFFFWYDMRARSEAISKITDVGSRKRLQQRQREIVVALPELDGCFVDSHELGRCYGTAMALLTLAWDE